jgi:acyl-coenzyme A thioesterase PaaI-like protein
MPTPDPGDIATIPQSDGGVLLCFACQETGTCRLGISKFNWNDDGSLVADVSCPVENQGGPGVAHGGWVASVLDEVVGLVCVTKRHQLTVTSDLTVRYLKPTPVEVPLQIVARVDRSVGVRVYASGELVLASSGVTLARSRGVFVARDPGHFARHEEWLKTQSEVQE